MLLAGGKSGLRAPAPKRLRRPLGLAIVVCLLAIGVEGAALAPNGVTRRAITTSSTSTTSQEARSSRPASSGSARTEAPDAGRVRQDEAGRHPLLPDTAGLERGLAEVRQPPNWGYFDVQVALAAQANLNVLPCRLLDAFLAGAGLEDAPGPHRGPANRVVGLSDARRSSATGHMGSSGSSIRPCPTCRSAPGRSGTRRTPPGTRNRSPSRTTRKLLKISSKAIKAGRPWRERGHRRPLWSAAASEDLLRHRLPEAPLQDQGGQVELRRASPCIPTRTT